jgi:hypothetical protein
MNWFTERLAPALCMACVVVALTIAAPNPGHAQNWERKYGGGNDEYGFSVTPIQNDPNGPGGYVAAGTTNTPSAGGTDDIYVLKVDNWGVTLWQKSYDLGATTHEQAMSLYECSNGDILVAGVSGDRIGTCNVISTDNIFLMRISPSGSLLWASTYGGRDIEGDGTVTNMKVIETSVAPNAGDVVIASSTLSFGSGATVNVTPDVQNPADRDGLLMRTDNIGNLKWARTYGHAPVGGIGVIDYFTAVTEAMNGDLIAAGVTYLTANLVNPPRPFLVRASPNGMVDAATYPTTFAKTYLIMDQAAIPNQLPVEISAVRECPSAQNFQNIIMTGSCVLNPLTNPNYEMYILATSNGGIPLANLTCGDGVLANGFDEGRDIIETASGQFVAVGTTANLGAPGRGTAIYAIEVNKAPNPFFPPLDVMTKVWSQTYGDTWDDKGWAVAEVDNSGTFGTPGLIMAGSSHTNAFVPAHWQLYLLKVFGTNGTDDCSSAPNDQFTKPTMSASAATFESCKVRMQYNRIPTEPVRTWDLDPICE